VRPEELGKFKKITSFGIEPATFRFVVLNECLLFFVFSAEWGDGFGICLINNSANDTVAARLSKHPVHCCKRIVFRTDGGAGSAFSADLDMT
jgi:hypothetical protein